MFQILIAVLMNNIAIWKLTLNSRPKL